MVVARRLKSLSTVFSFVNSLLGVSVGFWLFSQLTLEAVASHHPTLYLATRGFIHFDASQQVMFGVKEKFR